LSDSWFKTEILGGLNGADVEFVDPSANDGEYGIVAVHLTTPTGSVVLDYPIKGFEELRRVTKEGGKISILIPNDPGIVYRLLRRLTTLRHAKKINLFAEAEIIHAIEHRNHYLQLETLLRYVFKNDELITRSFPFKWRCYNLNAITVFEVTVLARHLTNP
jgi:SAM-dependent methyltransferase